jgi:DNA/RNA-binding domain of Phe-tRNA-synthetase-like protein
LVSVSVVVFVCLAPETKTKTETETKIPMIPFTLTLPILTCIIEVDGVTVSDAPAGYDGLVLCAGEHRARAEAAGITAPGAYEGVAVARRLFHALGIDATKRRPSSESLLNRVLKDKPLPRVNTLVDAGNWWSLQVLLPVGIYDAGRIDGAVTLRAGAAGEAYDAIGDKTIHCEGRYVLADETGPFGTPMTDSMRTRVRPETTRTFLVGYAPGDYDRPAFDAHAALLGERVVAACGGAITRSDVVAG